jgi:hypothetical protein
MLDSTGGMDLKYFLYFVTCFSLMVLLLSVLRAQRDRPSPLELGRYFLNPKAAN